MEKLTNCEIVINIELIELIIGGNERFEILFTTKSDEKYRFIFDFVWDMRYSIENASLNRFYHFRECLNEGFKNNGVYVVEDSEYIRYFENQVSGTRPVSDLVHYIICDEIDTVIDVLANKAPILVKLS